MTSKIKNEKKTKKGIEVNSNDLHGICFFLLTLKSKPMRIMQESLRQIKLSLTLHSIQPEKKINSSERSYHSVFWEIFLMQEVIITQSFSKLFLQHPVRPARFLRTF